MKKILFIAAVLICSVFSAKAQNMKFAMIDMEYVLRNVPQYEMANEQLNQSSQRWEKELSNLQNEAQTLLNNYQSNRVFMTEEQQKEAEAEVVAKDKEVMELRRKYFGPEGELFKKRQSLMKPIQEDVYNAVKAVAEEKGYKAVFDRSSSQSIVYASPTVDISNDVLAKLGYSK